MPTITLKAHYDGEHILLDEPFALPLGSQLMVTVVPPVDDERTQWARLSAIGLARAYGDDEPEYSLADVTP